MLTVCRLTDMSGSVARRAEARCVFERVLLVANTCMVSTVYICTLHCSGLTEECARHDRFELQPWDTGSPLASH